MKTTSLNRFAVVLLLTCVAPLTGAHAQGPLTPPGGPTPGMRSLDQIEPRTPITSLPYTINESGSYIVTGPLVSTNHGIIVQAHNVTVDLMGFTITGSSSTDFHGILAQGGEGIPLRNVHVRNGGVQNFGHGVRFENVNGGSVRHLTALQNAGHGIHMTSLSAPGNVTRHITIEHCEAMDNGNHGIALSGDPFAEGFVVRHNTLRGNDNIGIFIFRPLGCVVTDNFIGPQGGTNTVGIFTYQLQRTFMARNVSIDNETSFTGAGVRGPTVGKEAGSLSDTGIESHPHANFAIRPD